NLLTKSDVFAEDKLFATLDSTTRNINFAGEKILISDTVGFIRKLPAHLVASFKSTLNEVRESDIILHIIDLSHPYYEDHLRVVDDTLKEFDSEHKKEIKVFNKVDSVEDKSIIEYVRNKFPGSVVISAQKGINISALIKAIEKIIKDEFVEEELTLGIEQTKLASQIHDLAEVTSVKYNHDTVVFKFRANKENAEKIKKLISKA
ncbi:MAG: GTPase HflX, partial [Ignavibacteriaceae bacterium]|nr:GTPase HflX [Ignavibacteriaceae bacterium]